MLVLHHLNDSRSQRILWALEELAVPYEVVRYDRDSKTMLAPASLAKVHPLGKSPVVVDEGHTIAESGAILEYLIERYGGKDGAPDLAPAADALADRMKYRFWLHYAEGLAHAACSPAAHHRSDQEREGALLREAGVQGDRRESSRRASSRRTSHGTSRSSRRSSRARPGWSARPLSGADIQMSFPLEAGRARGGITAATHPNIWAPGGAHPRGPAFKRALERGGPYSYGVIGCAPRA